MKQEVYSEFKTVINRSDLALNCLEEYPRNSYQWNRYLLVSAEIRHHQDGRMAGTFEVMDFRPFVRFSVL